MSIRAKLGAGVVLAPVAAMAALIVGLRAKYPPAIDPVRRLSRDHGNPRVLKTAGSTDGHAAIVRHVGRTSGRVFETPVTPTQTAGGFIIGLPYGPGTDWVENILAAGSATLVHEGRTYDWPEVVPLAAAAADFGSRQRRVMSLFAVRECLRLRIAEPAAPGPA